MKKHLLLIILLLTSLFSFGQVPTSERDALIALYNSANGANWTNNTNWNTADPVSTWHGVTVENNHVNKINLFYNNLTGTLPSELQDLTNLKQLIIAYNNLSGLIPNLTVITTFNQLKIENNYFQFGDFENEFPVYITYSDTDGYFKYIPMKKIDNEEVNDLVVGQDYNFTMSPVSGTGVTYQWYKNDIPISGATNTSYTITNAQESDSGDYVCKALSTIVYDLTIERETIHLYGTIDPVQINTLVALFVATDGVNWANSDFWGTSEPVYNWYGVTVQGNKIIGLDLANNNLSGDLPTGLDNLSNLKTLILKINQLTGDIPEEICNITTLEYLHLGQNPTFSGTIPTNIGNLTNLHYISFWGNDFTSTIPVSFYDLVNLQYISIGENQFSDETLDLTSFTQLIDLISVHENPFEKIDIRNGNNTNMNPINTVGCPNLTCIFVDDAAWSEANWTSIEPYSTFVETQAECDALGVNDEVIMDKFTVFPNPTNGIINIKSNSSDFIKRMSISNSLGQNIADNITTTKIDISNFTKGIYYLKIENAKGEIAVYKVLKN